MTDPWKVHTVPRESEWHRARRLHREALNRLADSGAPCDGSLADIAECLRTAGELFQSTVEQLVAAARTSPDLMEVDLDISNQLDDLVGWISDEFHGDLVYTVKAAGEKCADIEHEREFGRYGDENDQHRWKTLGDYGISYRWGR